MMQQSLPFDMIPFTRYGSYFAVSLEHDKEIYIRDLHGGDMAPSRLYKLCFDGVKPADVQAYMSESRLELSFADGMCKISLGDDDTLHILTDGARVRLEAVSARYDSLIPLIASRMEHQFYSQNLKIMIVGKGNVSFESEWSVSESKHISIIMDGRVSAAMCVLKSYKSVLDVVPVPDFEDAANKSAQAHLSWIGGETIQNNIERMANYIVWGNFVRKEGFLHYDAMYMNKLAMGNIWSWDNCFGAIALARTHPEAALDQLKILFELQDDSGALPDYVNDAFASFSCVKPPIYGFTALKLREKNEFFKQREVTELLYDKISKITDFWQNHRMDKRLGLPCYYHGNDSGWDNASVFHKGVPICSPDLCAYLIQQMDTLSVLAEDLGKQSESEILKSRSDKLFEAMMSKLYLNGRFVSRLCCDSSFDADAKSLLNLLPITIWYRLTQEITDELTAELVRSFEQNYGLSTENMCSSYYKKGGYWLGPIWAPVSYIFIDTLYKAGYYEIAARLAKKFIALPSVGGMAENFDPKTGEGYNDNAFAWTACVYLTLIEEFAS